ncbi:hypothetical protein J6590_004727 [Homalodisca vitripennis]|nr:hypothetical protein J6590_004727 [Homalodisca vitripennis]
MPNITMDHSTVVWLCTANSHRQTTLTLTELNSPLGFVLYYAVFVYRLIRKRDATRLTDDSPGLPTQQPTSRSSSLVTPRSANTAAYKPVLESGDSD